MTKSHDIWLTRYVTRDNDK